MLRRYLAAGCVGLLLGLWLVTAAYGALLLRRTTDLAQQVDQGVEGVRDELEHPRASVFAEHSFAEGRVVAEVRRAWAEGVPLASFPRYLVAEPPEAADRVRK